MNVDELERLYREDGDRLWRAVRAFANDRDVADDAVAEAFMQALRRGGEIRSARAWVWHVAFKIAAGELKERSRSAAQQEKAVEDPSSDGEVFDALALLSPRQRACVLLHHYAGYPVKEVASIVGTSGGAVRVHLSVGRRRLRELLKEEDDE